MPTIPEPRATRTLSRDAERRLHQAGAAAYHTPGTTRAPALDPKIRPYMDQPVGASLYREACTAWLAGWDAAADRAARAALTDDD